MFKSNSLLFFLFISSILCSLFLFIYLLLNQVFFMISLYLLFWFVTYNFLFHYFSSCFRVHSLHLYFITVCPQVMLYYFMYNIKKNIWLFFHFSPPDLCAIGIIYFTSVYKSQSTLLIFLFKQSIIFYWSNEKKVCMFTHVVPIFGSFHSFVLIENSIWDHPPPS